ncbi:MAG: hypothetical protein RLN80_02840 [Rhodospirillales bacterium]
MTRLVCWFFIEQIRNIIDGQPMGLEKTALIPLSVRNVADGSRSSPEDRLQPAPARAQFEELFAGSEDAGATGFVLARIPAGRPVLWVSDRMSVSQMGQPYDLGLRRFSVDPGQLLLVCANQATDVLWTMEEALKCSSLGAVIGEIWGNPKVLDFTSTKRLAVRAERSATHTFLIRYAAAEALSAARRRWRVKPLPSMPHPLDGHAPGPPRWRTTLFRARDTRPGEWVAQYEQQTHHLGFSPPFCDSAMAETYGRQPGG